MRMRFNSPSGTAFTVVICIIMAMMVPLLGQALAGHPAGSCLDVTPETDENTVGDTHTLTATLRQPKTDPFSMPVGEVSSVCSDADTATPPAGGGSPDTANAQTDTDVDFEVTGPSDPNQDGNTPATPDLTCTILAGASSCQQTGYAGTAPGTDTICAWIDEGKDAAVEGECGGTQEPRDRETPNATTGPNALSPDIDTTDVVEKTWRAGPPARLDCDDQSGDEAEINPATGTGSTETYTCRLTDQFGNPTNDFDPETNGTQSGTIQAENKNGPNDPDNAENYSSGDYNSCNPNTGGQCSIDVTAPESQSGTASICFWAQGPGQTSSATGTALCGGGNEPTGETENNDLADQVEKTWEARRVTQIDVEPESDANDLGETHTLTAQVFDQFGEVGQTGTQVGFEIVSGSPGDKDAGNNAAPPDLTCTTGANGQCSVAYSHNGAAGTDTICSYIDQDGQTTNGLTAPTVSGVTCDGEGVTTTGDSPGFDTQTESASADVDVVQKIWRTSTAPSRLDCTPETDTNPPGTPHTITCTSTNNAQTTTANTNIDVEATGPGDPDGGNTPTSPDFTCTTTQSGTCSFTHTSGQTTSGTTVYRAWIDADNNSSTPDGDEDEQRSETGGGAGDTPEPDDTDVVEKQWSAGGRIIDCSPETATNEAGTTHDVTCNVKDRSNNNVGGQTVTATSSGVGTFQGGGTTQTKNTDTSGNVVFTITTTRQESGLQTVVAKLPTTTGTDECERNAEDPPGAAKGVCEDTVNKTWTAFTPTTPPEGFPRDVTLEASHNRRSYGKDFTLTATVTSGSPDTPSSCIQGVPVELERTVVGTTNSVPMGTTSTDSNGVATFTLSADRSANYVAHLDQTSQCAEANSVPEQVLVKKVVRLTLSDNRVDRGDRVRLRVKVLPCGGQDGPGHPRDRVVLYKRVKGSMAKIDAARTDRRCRAVFRRTVRKDSVFQARSPKQDDDHLGGKSRKKMVEVRGR